MLTSVASPCPSPAFHCHPASHLSLKSHSAFTLKTCAHSTSSFSSWPLSALPAWREPAALLLRSTGGRGALLLLIHALTAMHTPEAWLHDPLMLPHAKPQYSCERELFRRINRPTLSSSFNKEFYPFSLSFNKQVYPFFELPCLPHNPHRIAKLFVTSRSFSF